MNRNPIKIETHILSTSNWYIKHFFYFICKIGLYKYIILAYAQQI